MDFHAYLMKTDDLSAIPANKGYGGHVWSYTAPLVYASEHGMIETVKQILRLKQPSESCLDNAMERAAVSGHLDVVEVLLQQGASIHTAMYWGICHQQIDIIEALAKVRCNYPWNLIQLAVESIGPEKAKINMIDFFLVNGYDVNSVNSMGRTSLFSFSDIHETDCEFPGLELFRYLLDKGADINRQDKDGKTLIMAVLEDQLKRDSMELLNESFNIVMNKQENRLFHFLTILTEYGANPFIVDSNEYDAWDYAKLFPGGIETMKSVYT